MKSVKRLVILWLLLSLCAVGAMARGCVHEWGDFEIFEMATCGTDGLCGYRCVHCGELHDTRVLPRTDEHRMTGEMEVKTAATCHSEGVGMRQCDACGQWLEVTILPLEHTYEMREIASATCTQPGTAQLVCTVCGDTQETQGAPATGHRWGQEKVLEKPTCMKQGRVQHTCSRCGEVMVGALATMNAHNYGEWVTMVEPTDHSAGERVRTCECGKQETEEVYPEGTLMLGAQGAAVRTLQEMLIACVNTDIEENGQYDNDTLAAVADFQEKVGLDQDGIAWPQTLRKLEEKWKEVTATPVPTATPEPTPVPTVEPTAEPTSVPTTEPTAEPTAEPSVEPTAEPTPEPTPVPTPEATMEPALVANGEYSTLKMDEAVMQGADELRDYEREEALSADVSAVPGVLTFRGDGMRQNAAYGTVGENVSELRIVWKTGLGALYTADHGRVYGAGWTGQPAVVQWSDEALADMNIVGDKRVSGLREVILAAQDGKVYFLDLKDGKATRDEINIGYSLRGSVTVDGAGRPIIGFGQALSRLAEGIRANGPRRDQLGYHVYSLIDQSELFFINGRKNKDQVQDSTNGAFDGTGLMVDDTLLVAGENGLLYAVDMNTKWENGKLSVSPETVYLRSRAQGVENLLNGMESSIAMYDHYVFMVDAYGALRCVDTTTMRTVWAQDMGDNVDATIALEKVQGGLMLYIANSKNSRIGGGDPVAIRCLDALTGKTVWEHEVIARTGKKTTHPAGTLASPVVGSGAIKDLVIFTVNNAPSGGSTVLALSKADGRSVWEFELSEEAISSPIAVYDAQDNAYIVQGGVKGSLYLLDGDTGKAVTTMKLSGQILSSPAAYDNMLVVATGMSGSAAVYGIAIE